MRERAREALEWLGINIDVNQPVSSLTTAQQQGVELAKVLHVAKKRSTVALQSYFWMNRQPPCLRRTLNVCSRC